MLLQFLSHGYKRIFSPGTRIVVVADVETIYFWREREQKCVLYARFIHIFSEDILFPSWKHVITMAGCLCESKKSWYYCATLRNV